MTVGLRSKIKLGVRSIKGKVRPVWRSVSVVRKHRKGVRQTMGRQPCCDKVGLKKGPWTAEEDKKLIAFILTNGQCCWRAVPKLAGLLRCGKSCRLRWTNYLRPDLKRGLLSDDEEQMVIELHSQLGNRWSKIASHLPGRTDNEIKNHWNTHIKKKLRKMGIDPLTHKPLHEEPCLHSSPKVPAERVEGKNTTSTSATCSLSPSSSCSSEKTEEIQLPRMEWPESAYLYGLDDLDGWDFTSDHLLLDSFGQCQRAALDQESWKFELF